MIKSLYFVLTICLCVQNIFSQKTHIVEGNFIVHYPTNDDKLEVEIYDKLKKENFIPKEQGEYMLTSEVNRNYKILFSVNNQKDINSVMTILNNYPNDSLIITHNNLKFISSKLYKNKYLSKEYEYLGDSLFSYKQYFSNARYEGKVKLYKHGFFNREHKEFNENNELRQHNYYENDILYKNYYSLGYLIRQKYIQDEKRIIKYFEEGSFTKKDVYEETKEYDYFITSYDINEKQIEQRKITQEMYLKEFPSPYSGRNNN